MQCTVQMTEARTVSVTFTPIVVADMAPPGLVITSHSNNQTVNSNQLTVSGTASETASLRLR
jgi:hypothetical protein